jgi:UDP-N-acetylglucosamine transferase subunit ALG13
VILVTVGMQLGFDRLIKAMDELAPALGHEVIAQVGKGTYQPRHMTARSSISPAEFEQLVQQAALIVSHAGIGTILTAARFGRPVVLMPRRAALGEHRNDHQLATVRQLAGRGGILVAEEESELASVIAQGLALTSGAEVQSATAQRLHEAVRRFIISGSL